MDLPELLRSQAKRYRCAVCNTNMADCGIKVITQQGNRALVRVTCASCNDENLLQIIFQTDGEPIENEGQKVATISEGIPQVPDPISSDELLDLRDLLSAHQGGFRELLEGKLDDDRAEVTAERVKAHFGRFVRGPVERYEAPNVWALNFVLHDALGGGAPRSLRADNLGKTLGGALVRLEIEVPEQLADRQSPKPDVGWALTILERLA